MKPLALLLFSALLLLGVGCASVDKLVDRGDYERSIRLAQKRLSGKQKKNPKFVAALETAVNKANQRDLDQVERIAKGGDPDWVAIHEIYEDIDARQRALEPLLPLTDKNGRVAEFRLVKLDHLLTESNDRAADQYYRDGLSALEDARAGDKAAARDAYYLFSDISNHHQGYRNAETLRQEARELGKVFITVSTENATASYLPRGFEEELLRLNTSQLNDEWHFYDLAPRAEIAYDYTAKIVINNIEVSPERISESNYTDEREIVDGVEYTYDSAGNVAKDSLGNDITRPRRILIRADITEVLQSKTALVEGSVVLTDLRENRVVEERRLTAEANWENYASSYRGDRRALSRESRRNLGNRPARFPTDESLILDAADELKPELQRIIRGPLQLAAR